MLRSCSRSAARYRLRLSAPTNRTARTSDCRHSPDPAERNRFCIRNCRRPIPHLGPCTTHECLLGRAPHRRATLTQRRAAVQERVLRLHPARMPSRAAAPRSRPRQGAAAAVPPLAQLLLPPAPASPRPPTRQATAALRRRPPRRRQRRRRRRPRRRRRRGARARRGTAAAPSAPLATRQPLGAAAARAAEGTAAAAATTTATATMTAAARAAAARRRGAPSRQCKSLGGESVAHNKRACLSFCSCPLSSFQHAPRKVLPSQVVLRGKCGDRLDRLGFVRVPGTGPLREGAGVQRGRRGRPASAASVPPLPPRRFRAAP